MWSLLFLKMVLLNSWSEDLLIWLVLVEHYVLLFTLIELGDLLCNFLTRFVFLLLGWQFYEICRCHWNDLVGWWGSAVDLGCFYARVYWVKLEAAGHSGRKGNQYVLIPRLPHSFHLRPIYQGQFSSICSFLRLVVKLPVHVPQDKIVQMR